MSADFKKSVSKASSNVIVVQMTPEEFLEWQSFKSATKIDKMAKKFLLPEVKTFARYEGQFCS